MDGYIEPSDVSADEELSNVLSSHIKVRHRLREIDAEIQAIPNPFVTEGWVTSIPDMGSDKRFKISDFKRLGKLRREYRKLKDTEEQNIRFLKLRQIDGVILQLEEINKKSEGS
jgi:hypothetical protein